MGICIGEIDGRTRTLRVIESITLVIDKAIKVNDYQRYARFTKHELIEEYLAKVLGDLLVHYDIDAVVFEAAYHSVSLIAYESLLFYGRVIRRISSDYDWDLLIESKSPSTVKKVNGVNGKSSDKNLVTEAVRANSNIIIPDSINLDNLTEHAVDAIAIAYSVVYDLAEALPPP